MERKIKMLIRDFYTAGTGRALLITGARQVGKTYVIREFLRERGKSYVEINFIENPAARDLFLNARSSQDILLRLSVLTDQPLIKGETIIFFDEVQECKELITAVKFLVEDSDYQYIMSGSLLGVELKDIRSVPVGYLEIMEMYPMDFEEFCYANGVSGTVVDTLRECFEQGRPVDALIHDKMMDLFRLYLLVGGMPAAVTAYLGSNNLRKVTDVQRNINAMYKRDIAKYDPDSKLYLEEIFDLIPAELNSKNKRFILKNINENFKFSRYEHSFIWLKDAGVALPVYCAAEPKLPLLLSRSTNLFKLFLSDVGLLASMYLNDIQIRVLNREQDINFGSVYENAVAQELKAHGFDLYYYNNKRQGELDFMIEYQGEVLPVEVKSGKDYTRHAALQHVLENSLYDAKRAFVFCNENVQQKGKIMYYPIYMISFVQKENQPEDLVYRLELPPLMKA